MIAQIYFNEECNNLSGILLAHSEHGSSSGREEIGKGAQSLKRNDLSLSYSTPHFRPNTVTCLPYFYHNLNSSIVSITRHPTTFLPYSCRKLYRKPTVFLP